MDCRGSPTALGRVVCPKPHRAGESNFNNPPIPLRLHMRNDIEALDSKLGTELLDLICRKDIEAEWRGNVSSSPPFFFGSPPCRAPNPLVQDADFGVEKPTSSPLGSTTPPSAHTKAKFGKKQATVRVEGFECRSPRFIAMV